MARLTGQFVVVRNSRLKAWQKITMNASPDPLARRKNSFMNPYIRPDWARVLCPTTPVRLPLRLSLLIDMTVSSSSLGVGSYRLASQKSKLHIGHVFACCFWNRISGAEGFGERHVDFRDEIFFSFSNRYFCSFIYLQLSAWISALM